MHQPQTIPASAAVNDAPCIFPSIAGRYTDKIKFDDHVVRALQGLACGGATRVHLALSAVWAIGLWRFAECDTPRFRVRMERDVSNNGNPRIFGTPIDPARPVSWLFDEKNWERCNVTADHTAALVNTEMVVGAASDMDAHRVSLALHLGQAPTVLTLVYNSGHLSEQYARHLVSGLSHAVGSIARNPAQPIDQVDFCCPSQRAQVAFWNRTPLMHPTDGFLFQYVDRQARMNPTGVAVDSWDGCLTYHELRDLTDRVANYLQTRGVQGGVLVPVCFEKSLWAIAAMLAVNKGGGAFVPCDPAYPESRRRAIVEKTKAQVILVSDQTASLFSSFDIPTIVVSASTSAQWTLCENGPAACATHDSPAYCFFTSGSTGEPKGCQVSHLALASVSQHVDALHLRKTSRSLQFASYCFGVSLIELWCTLVSGGTICIPSDHERLHSLAEFLVQKQVNWALLTPTVLETLSPANIGDIDLLIAGEALEPHHITTWAPAVRLYQAYGLTEWAGIFAVSQRIVSLQDRGSVGLPVNGTAWVVDPSDHQKHAPIGAVGELLIGGPSLADGYLNDAVRTDHAFVSGPSWSMKLANLSEPQRVYKTGDLVRYGEDGSIRYVRRNDNQVKIRGQRLEIGEVESRIRQCLPSTRKVIVMVHSFSGERVQQQSLVAFVLLSASSTVQKAPSLSHGGLRFVEVNDNWRSLVQGLEKRLQFLLPGFMVPQMFLPVSSIPTTITGKADRRTLCREANSLPYHELHRLAGLVTETRAPLSDQEEQVHRAAAVTLGLEPGHFGMLDNFFHLGGNSAVAVKLVIHLRKKGLNVGIADIYNNPVLRDLAVAAGQHDPAQSKQSNGVEADVDMGHLPGMKAAVMEQTGLPEDQIEKIYPATPFQAGLVAMTGRSPRLCQAQVTCELRPGVEIEAFQAAWERVFQMNDILRTRFVISPSHGTMQVVTKEALHWYRVDTMSACARHIGSREMGIGGRLVHSYLVPTAADGQTWSFIVVLHHGLCDQWSFRLLLKQIEAAYRNLPVSRHLFNPFVSYMARIQDQFKEYWVKELDDVQSVAFPALPSPHYIPAATEELTFMMALPGRSTRSYTMSSYLTLAWALVTSYHTGSNDIVFGLTVNGRGAAVDGISEIVGPTIATIPRRIKLSPKDSIMARLSQVQIQLVKGIPFEQAGLHNIQKYSPSTRRACMFQNQLIIQPPSQPPTDTGPWEDFKFSATAVGGFSAYGLSIECLTALEDRECKAVVTFDPAMIGRGYVHRLMQHTELVLQRLLTNSRQKVGDIPRVTQQDWDWLQRWNRDIPSAPTDCVHDLIQKRHLAAPNALAVMSWDGNLSYSELTTLSDKLAGELLLHGVKPGMPIPLLFEKSKWTTVAILATIKAGCAFALLDPIFPLRRLQAICSDIDAPCTICSEGQVGRADKLTGRVIGVYDTAAFWGKKNPTRLPVVQPQDPLYLVFTSGSTGTPKGIVIDHQSYCSSSKAHNKAHLVDESSRVLQFASYAFDVSIMESLSTLLAGGCICVLSESERRENLAGAVQRYRTTHAFLTPSTTRLLMHQDIASLRVIVMGGEVMSPADSSYWVDRVHLINEYGVAECCVASTARHITRADDPVKDIGFPLGVATWVADQTDYRRLVPIGAVGELLVEGFSIGRGYLNNPEATGKAFVQAPDWLTALRQGKATRIYRTGDLVQQNEDGSLLFLGRKDAQFKIRGQRFELEEVEYHIRGFKGVLDVVTVVAAPLVEQEAPRLAAFIAQRDADNTLRCQETSAGATFLAPPTESFQHLTDEIQTGLHSILPDYMVPSIYLPVTSVPKTDSGKGDRRRLKEVIEQHTWAELIPCGASSLSKAKPSTDVEERLHATWAHVLGLSGDSIGVNNSFYDLGGDSVSAMQVVAQARSRGLVHSTHHILQLKTIAAIAKEAVVTASPQSLMQDDVTNELFDLSPIQLFFFEKYPDGTSRFNQTMLVHVQQPVASTDIERAVTQLVRRHSILRARYVQDEDGNWKQYLSKATKDSFKFRSHLVSSEQEKRQIITASQGSLDIVRGPVFVVDLFELGGKQCLFMIGHHLVIDLVSWRIMLADMDAMLRGGRSEPEPAMSFQAWSRLQTEYARNHLEPADVHMLPRIDQQFIEKFWGASGNPNLIGDSESKMIRLDDGTTDAIFTQSSRALGVEPVELLHAALLFSFMQTFPDRATPSIYAEAHGREPWDPTIDITRTVGWFTTLWPVVVQLETFDDLRATIEKVKVARRQRTNNGWDYFTSIYKNSQNKGQSAGMPPIEITFNYAGKFQQAEHADALLRMEPLSKQSLFDGAGDLDRWAMFEINSVVSSGCLEFHMTYNAALSKDRVLMPWIGNLTACLHKLATNWRDD
ncbi:acetyl-CoA synthetase-like protein [Aspergillus campestris IBT 28561]|uniref:Acetyl-CoA synthetase-like protein n=1 Tax=Aspergillus campestris (strain IBT 28561) TaxID=1392248 RepID=A0A2I1DB26_ASPC2|nr:acetyl-CoA synthetase-like protein [Aspergillus campestris IBT 28561]PKY07074.1 acetyl-CoA synthetase-like protein [Aspergillus campestris IBT 28561]